MNDNHDGEKPEDRGYTKEFSKCPGCGSEERYFEDILNELKEKNLIDNKVTNFDFQVQQGIPLPQQKIASLPFGSEIPAFYRVWDTCCNCGMVYSTHLRKTVARKSIDLSPRQPVMPNRAQRRQLERLN